MNASQDRHRLALNKRNTGDLAQLSYKFYECSRGCAKVQAAKDEAIEVRSSSDLVVLMLKGEQISIGANYASLKRLPSTQSLWLLHPRNRVKIAVKGCGLVCQVRLAEESLPSSLWDKALAGSGSALLEDKTICAIVSWICETDTKVCALSDACRDHLMVTLIGYLEKLHFQAADPIDSKTIDASASGKFQRIRGHLLKQLHANVNLSELCRMQGMGPRSLSSAFKQATGLSVSEYVRHARLKVAKDLLRSSDADLAEIACSVGFSDQNTFSKMFKRLSGNSPGRFRSRRLEKT